MRIFILAAFLPFLTGCLEKPDFETGEGCWRYGVLENGNTGRMTQLPIADIPVIKVNYEELVKACGLKDEPLSWRNRDHEANACFKLRDIGDKDGIDTIYLLKWYAGKMDLYEEKCHALLGRKHNACTGYGIGNDESACEWK